VTLGLFALLLAGAGFCFAIHLAGVQAHGLAVRYVAPDEKRAIAALQREYEHGLRMLLNIKHPIRDPGPDAKWP
jgi:hypothetical protein